MKRTFAALTAVALAAGLSLAAVVAPASATTTPSTPAPVASSTPTSTPSAKPVVTPSATPSAAPTATATAAATATPTAAPTAAPAAAPTTTTAAPTVAEFAAASTKYNPPVSNPTTFETVIWSMPSGSAIKHTDGEATYPQTFVKAFAGETTENLNVDYAYTCGVSYQVDVYAQTFDYTDNTAKLAALFTAGLAGPQNGDQDGSYLAGSGKNPGVSGEGHAWKYVTVACPPPPPPCVADSSVTYSYNAANNTGSIVVPNPRGSSGVLCTPFYVTATSWTYDVAGQSWPQTFKYDQHLKDGTTVGGTTTTAGVTSNVAISKSGTYPYSAPVACGQGDIYASTVGTDATLFPETAGHLNGPSNPFTEHFLSDLANQLHFTGGTSPTYMNTGTNCNTNATPVKPAVSLITTCGQLGSFTIPTASATPGVVYTYNGVTEAAGTVISGLSGSQTVVATPASGYKFTGSQTVSYTQDFGTSSTCSVTIGDPGSASPVCTGPNSPDNGSIFILSNVNVKYTLTGANLPVAGEDFASSPIDGTQETISGLAPGDYTVIATGLNGHLLTYNGSLAHTANGLSTLSITIPTLTTPNCLAVAPTVTSTAPTCAPDTLSAPVQGGSAPITAADTEVQGIITINAPVPDNGNLTYQIDNVTVGVGPHHEGDGTHTVTATLTAAEIAAGITIVADPGVYTLSAGGTVATWTITFNADCSVLPAWNANATSTDATCAASSLGTITLSHEQGTQPNDVKYVVTNDANSHVVYSGTDVNDTVLKVAAGHYTVVASPVNPADGISGNAGPFAVTVAAVTAICGGGDGGLDTSLAFTGGTIAWFGFVLAGGMLFLGIAFLLIRRRGNRTAE